jgi:hypothetical protein
MRHLDSAFRSPPFLGLQFQVVVTNLVLRAHKSGLDWVPLLPFSGGTVSGSTALVLDRRPRNTLVPVELQVAGKKHISKVVITANIRH